ncbi:MAG: DinB family protein [Candidatus Acidiferrum sp.]
MEIHTIQPFLQYCGSVRERTVRVARCIPPDKIEWSYAPGKFTPGDLLRHIAVTERYLFAENIQGKPSRYTSHGKEWAEGLEAVLALMERLHKESMEIFAKLSDAALQEKCMNVGGMEISRWKWMRSMAEHEIHHRGQLYVYVGILGVPTPPLYGVSSEEVRARGEL